MTKVESVELEFTEQYRIKYFSTFSTIPFLLEEEKKKTVYWAQFPPIPNAPMLMSQITILFEQNTRILLPSQAPLVIWQQFCARTYTISSSL